jgi:hypothetical protein
VPALPVGDARAPMDAASVGVAMDAAMDALAWAPPAALVLEV